MRLKELEREALHKLANQEGISAANYVLNHIHRQAEKKGIPV